MDNWIYSLLKNVQQLICFLYKLNTHEKSPFIRYVQAHELTIECDKNIIYDIDGEEGTRFPIHVTTKNKALCIIVP